MSDAINTMGFIKNKKKKQYTPRKLSYTYTNKPIQKDKKTGILGTQLLDEIAKFTQKINTGYKGINKENFNRISLTENEYDSRQLSVQQQEQISNEINQILNNPYTSWEKKSAQLTQLELQAREEYKNIARNIIRLDLERTPEAKKVIIAMGRAQTGYAALADAARRAQSEPQSEKMSYTINKEKEKAYEETVKRNKQQHLFQTQ